MEDSIEPRLMGAAEIREALGGVGETRGRQIMARPSFPRPHANLKMGKVWLAASVQAWIAENRKPAAIAEPPEGEPDAG